MTEIIKEYEYFAGFERFLCKKCPNLDQDQDNQLINNYIQPSNPKFISITNGFEPLVS